MRSLIISSLAVFLLCSFTPTSKELKMAADILAKTVFSQEIQLRKEAEYYTIIRDQADVGRLLFRQVTPRGETFTYFVAIDNEGNILKLHITDYPSQHGAKITNRKWLDKWVGKSPSSQSFGDEVDAITGATLSVNALINDLRSVSIP